MDNKILCDSTNAIHSVGINKHSKSINNTSLFSAAVNSWSLHSASSDAR